MEDDQNSRAGSAALTLIESLFIHLQETGRIDEDGRDQIFETAIDAHRVAQQTNPSVDHGLVVALLRRLQARADGVQVIGELRSSDKAPE